MPGRVIFLDIDGVLVNLEVLYSRKRVGGHQAMAPDCVRWLNWLTDQTGAGLVVTSSWRKAGLGAVQTVLSANGVTGKLLGLTPVLRSEPRGAEIQRWLDDRPSVVAFVILDDDADMGDLADFLVRTVSTAGLSGAEAHEAAAILNTVAA